MGKGASFQAFGGNAETIASIHYPCPQGARSIPLGSGDVERCRAPSEGLLSAGGVMDEPFDTRAGNERLHVIEWRESSISQIGN